jgi:hypothetical protein
MKRRLLYLTLLFMALGSLLNAGQEKVFAKGKFEVFTQPGHHRSKLEQKSSAAQRNTVWTNDCESDTGWALEAGWEVGAPLLGPDCVPQGNHCLATNLDGFYNNSANIHAKSAMIQLPAASYIELNFQEYFELESNWDFAYVEVLSYGSSYRLDARTGTSGGQYRNTSLNLSQFQEHSIQLVFRLTSDESVPGAGWYIDDISITTVAPLPLDLQISGINHNYHPSIYLTATVNSPQGMITDLTTANFTVQENSIVQNNFFAVVSPDDTEQSSATDIVFVLDVTGSMSEEINAVRSNMMNFMNQLQADNIDYRIGFVVFGDIVYVYNQYNFYSNFTQIMGIINNITLGENGIGYGGDAPENQFGAMAEAALFQWRPGASRVMIMLTDAPSHQADSVTQWTAGDLLAERLLPNNIIVFPVFDVSNPTSMDQYLPIAEQTNPNGSYFNIYDNFNSIINQIGAFISSLYTVHYVSQVPFEDPITRMVTLQVNEANEQSIAYAFYIPGISPTIRRSETLELLDGTSVAASSSITFDVVLRDRLAPGIQSKLLNWRRIGQSEFQTITLQQTQDDHYQAILPSTEVFGTGIEYFFLASDGQSTTTLPSSTPQLCPFYIAINPNAHAQFSSVTAVYTAHSNFSISLNCSSPESRNLKLFYRPMGSLVYRNIAMTPSGSNAYHATISEDLGELGVQYYLLATQNNQLCTYYGDYDQGKFVGPATVHEPDVPPSGSISTGKVFPNPVAASGSANTIIGFELKDEQLVNIEIFNIKGQKIKTLAHKKMSKGSQQVYWDCTDSSTQKVSSGIYLYRISGKDMALSGKILVSK